MLVDFMHHDGAVPDKFHDDIHRDPVRGAERHKAVAEAVKAVNRAFSDFSQFSKIRKRSISTFFHDLCFSFAEEIGITYSFPLSSTRIPR